MHVTGSGVGRSITRCGIITYLILEWLTPLLLFLDFAEASLNAHSIRFRRFQKENRSKIEVCFNLGCLTNVRKKGLYPVVSRLMQLDA